MNLSFLKQLIWVMLLSSITTLAYASGTQAGTDVTNTATLTFGDTADATTDIQSNPETFTVDKKIDMTVTTVDVAAIQTKPSATGVVLTYKVTNTGNSIQDFSLTALTTSTTAFGGDVNDTFDATNVKIYVDTDNNGVFDAANDTETDYIDELGIDAEKFVFIVADMPDNLTNGAAAIYDLQAQVAEGGVEGTKGANITSDSKNDEDAKDTVQIVFADSAGTADTQYDGKFSSADAYKIVIANMTISKISVVVNDPVNGITKPKRIPGATIRYCFTVENSGSANAAIAKIGDTLDTSVYDLSALSNNDIKIYTGTEQFNCATADTLTPLETNPGSVDTNTGAIVIDLQGVDAGTKKSAYFDVVLR